jgi:myosin I
MICRLILFRLTRVLGWWLAERLDHSASGWAPSAYLEEHVSRPAPPPPPPAAPRVVPTPPVVNGVTSNGVRAKPGPPAPPAKRPAAKRPVPAGDPRDSGYSGSDTTRDSSGSIAGGLAEALRQRQAALQGKKNDDDDW